MFTLRHDSKALYLPADGQWNPKFLRSQCTEETIREGDELGEVGRREPTVLYSFQIAHGQVSPYMEVWYSFV